ncbi:hypothetical protein [Polaromonas sp. CG9_12]|nr:hypothetical protein [Polaromonas sp. CG9_12]
MQHWDSVDIVQTGSRQSRQCLRSETHEKFKMLVSAGLLKDGEWLFLVDYQDQKIVGYETTVSGSSPVCKGQIASMSKLAQEQLKKVGFENGSVRGPAHWINAKGVSVGKLRQQLTEQQAKNKK